MPGAHRPGTGCPARYRTAHSRRPSRGRPGLRENRGFDQPVGGGSPRLGPRPPTRTTARRNRPAIRLGIGGIRPVHRLPLTLTLPKRGTGPVFRPPHPEVDRDRPASRSRSALRSPYGVYLAAGITPGQKGVLN